MNDSPTIDGSLPPPPPRRDGLAQEGETFQHYQVLRREDGTLWELGRGAMGVTYKAFDTNLRCEVALKVISAEYIHSELAGQRFVREARVAARLRHPNIASVYHLGVDPQGFFYSMEFIDGETLEDLVARIGPLPLETVLHIGRQVARALAAAAKQGLIHRDIKPANVMVLRENEEGEDRLSVKVIDFGLARTYAPEDSAPQLTATGFVGTPMYASPEQLEEQDLDVRSDIYSLGVTLWILLVGRPPFEGKMTQVITQHLHAPPPWWQLPACPEPVRLLLEKMLQKNRLQRYQSAGELRTAIESCLQIVTNREDLLLGPATESSAPQGEPVREGLATVVPTGVHTPASLAATAVPTTGTVVGHLGAAARTLVQTASRRRLTWLLAAGVLAVVLLGMVFWRAEAPRPSASLKSNPAATPAPSPAVATAEPAPTPPPAVALDTPAPAANPTPEPVLVAPEPTPAVTPPPLVAAASPAPSGLDGAEGSPSDSPAAAAVATDSPAPSPTASEAHDDNAAEANASPTPAAKGSSAKSRSTHRSARAAPTPAPNFFQKLFGIKPKPTPRKGR